jgi:hypothetical protein
VSAARRALWIAVAFLGTASAAAAQTNRAPARPARFMVSAGLLANGGYDLGDRAAELRGNSVTNATPFTLFRADGAMDRATGLDGRFAYALTRALSIEVGGSWSKPDVNVTVAQDTESTGTTLVAETVSQYTVDFGGLFWLPSPQGGRFRPYALGGGGYLRQLHENHLVVETGHTIFGGGGVHYAFRAPARGRGPGVRAEARFVRRAGGIDFEDKSRSHLSISVLGFIGF